MLTRDRPNVERNKNTGRIFIVYYMVCRKNSASAIPMCLINMRKHAYEKKKKKMCVCNRIALSAHNGNILALFFYAFIFFPAKKELTFFRCFDQNKRIGLTIFGPWWESRK